MKYTLLVLASLTGIGQAQAQKDSSWKSNETGVFAETSLTGGGAYFSTAGVTYSRWHNHNVAFKVTAGYTSYTSHSGISAYNLVNNDTLVQRFSYEHAGLATVGAGIEVQRHFYRRVFLDAGVDLKAGYGKGRVDTNLNSSALYSNNSEPNSQSVNGTDLTMYMLVLSPYIGARLVYSHVAFGVQVSANFNACNIKYGGTTSGNNTMNFDAGSLSNRLFIQFRF